MTELITTIGEIVRGEREIFPPYLYAAYQSTRRRAPALPLIDIPLTLSELTGPGPRLGAVTPEDADLTRNAGTGGEAIGQRIVVTGRVVAQRGEPVPHALVEIWQANASGRYLHKRDNWPGALDPNFLGMGRCLTDAANPANSLETRFTIANGAGHQFLIAALKMNGYRTTSQKGHRMVLYELLDGPVPGAAGAQESLARAHNARNKAEYDGDEFRNGAITVSFGVLFAVSAFVGFSRSSACTDLRLDVQRQQSVPPPSMIMPQPLVPHQGGEREMCRPDGTCDPGLTCASSLCVRFSAPSPTPSGQAGSASASP